MNKVYPYFVALLILFPIKFIHAQVGDGWNYRTISTYRNDVEVARIEITFVVGFSTTSHSDFHAYIDPDLPYNNGIPVTDGDFNMNYIRVYKPKEDNATTTIPQHLDLDYSKWFENITYYDGIGRPIQKIDVKGIPCGSDKIEPIKYDLFGRKKIIPLTYSLTQGGQNGPGGYRTSDLTEQESFYNCFYPGEGSFAKNINEYDNSPLNKEIQNLGPGQDWQTAGSTKPIQTIYETNGEEQVFSFSVSDNGELIKDGCYNQNVLFKTTTIDENGNKKVEYKNKINQVVASAENDGSLSLTTYYIYDKFERLRFIIPPKAVANIPSGCGSLTVGNETSWIRKLCFYFSFDAKGRIISKREPGCADIFMVYNNKDLLVLTQNGAERVKNQWFFYKYDSFGREVLTGMYNHGSSLNQEDMQSLFNTNTNYAESFSISNPIHGYSSICFPTSENSYDVFTVKYYDNYEFLNHSSNNGDYTFRPDEMDFMYLKSDQTKGLQTGEKAKVFEHDNITVQDNWLLYVNYYDKYENLIQCISDNHFGGKDLTSHKKNFSQQVLKTKTTHNNLLKSYTLLEEFEYNNVGLPIYKKMKYCDEPEVTCTKKVYNDFAQLKRKSLQSISESDFLQSLDYKSNIRGWLTDINDISNLNNDFFALKLDYTQGDHKHYNGNISSLNWISNIYPELKQYQINYDGFNRLKSAAFNLSSKYDVAIGGYDVNGNIESITRNGRTGGGTFGPIDDLTYSYDGNQVLSVNDNPGVIYQNNGFKDNGSFYYTEYFYDSDGNMIKDLNKQIEDVQYNYLNLPEKIEISAANQQLILYVYDAFGRELCKQTRVDQAITNTIDFCGNFRYENKALSDVITSEGRIVVNCNSVSYQYYIKDHLGSNRVLFDQNGTVLQDVSYYPFGLVMDGLSYNASNSRPNKFLFNGKDLQDDFQLGWYNFGTRFYDPEIARWCSIDPLARKYPQLSPFVYALNNPIRFIDPDGRDVFDVCGNLISTDNTNLIRIQSSNGLVKLSAFPMNNMKNRYAAANIAKYYGTQIGIYAPGYIGVGNYSKDNSLKPLAYTAGEDIYLNARGGGLNPLLDNTNNMKNSLYHEKLHKDRGHGFKGQEASNLEHAQVYLDQMNDKSFTNTTDKFKQGMIGSVSDYIEDAAYDMMNSTGDMTQVTDLVKALNDLSNVTGWKVSLQVVKNGFSDPSMYEFKVNASQKQEEKK